MRAQENRENPLRASDVENNARRENQPEPSSSRTLLTQPVLLTISAHGWFAFLEIASWVLLPLVYTTPVEFGGLGLDPATMGICMAVYGVLKGVLQLTVFHRILNFLGLRTALIAFMSSLIPLFLLFPIGSTHVRNAGTNLALWGLVLTQLVSTIGVNMAYGASRPFTYDLCLSNFVFRRPRLYLHIHHIRCPKRYARCDMWPRADCRIRAACRRPCNRGGAFFLLVGE
jgi:hypothetical protein